MTHPTDDEALLDRFREWLREARAEADRIGPDGEADPSGPGPEVGLYRLAEEFTALRHEVKLETKGSRGLQEQVEALLPAVRQAIDHIRSLGPKEEQAALAAARPMAEALADLDEALDRGRAEAEKARGRLEGRGGEVRAALVALFESRPWYRRIGLRAYHDRALAIAGGPDPGTRPGLAEALIEGYDLIRARLRRAMEAGQVRRIDCIGLPVDPALMAVVEAVDAPEIPAGTVVDELRRGYTWRGRVLRYAEVRASRGPDGGNIG